MSTQSHPLLAERFSLTAWADGPISDPSPPRRILHTLVRLVLITFYEFRRNVLSLRAGALTFTALLTLVPILAISTAVVKGLGGGDQLHKAVYSYIESLEEESVPILNASPTKTLQTKKASPDEGENLTDHLRSAVDRLFDYVNKTNFATLGSFGVAGILISVLFMLSYIEKAMNAIWNVPSGRPIFRKVTDYLTLLIIMPISINVAFAAGALLKSPRLASKIGLLIPFAWMQALLLKAGPICIIAFSFYVIYIFFPNTKVKSGPALIGAVLAAVIWFEVQNIFIALQIGVSKYNAIYGSFATFPLFLIWIYLGWLFILSGAQVAFACQHLRTYRLLAPAAVPSVKLSAAFDIMDCIYLAFSDKQPLTGENLPDRLSGYPPPVLAEILELLISAGLIHTSRSDDRLLPSLPHENYDGKAVVEIVLGTEAPDTTGGSRSMTALQAAAQAGRDRARPIEGNQVPEHQS